MVLIFSLYGSQLAAQEEDAPVMEVMREYWDIKKALVADNYDLVKQEVPFLKKELVDLNQMEGYAGLLENVDNLAMASDLTAQRQAFANISKTLFEFVKEKDLDQTLYWQVCPMALNGQGAGWLSFEEQVLNPYMGQSMPRCGKVQEVVE